MPEQSFEMNAQHPVRSASAGTVLLAEDDVALLGAEARILRCEGYDVIEARNGKEAIQALDAGEIDVLVADIRMPQVDGLELLRIASARHPDVPVILTTGKPSLDSAIQAVERRAFCYLAKPFTAQELVRRMGKALRLRQLARIKRQALALSGLPGGLSGDPERLQRSFEEVLRTLTVAYQPIVRAHSGERFGHEALLRSPSSDLPHPGAVLQAAERLQRTAELGRAIRARAAAPLLADHEIQEALFVNLHPQDLADEQLYDPDAPLSRIAPRVVLEITERASLECIGDVPGQVARLRGLGFRIAVDDLGAGYAGLSSFVALQPDIVKLDMSLVRDVDREPLRREVVRSLTDLCRKMDIQVVAEGIETEEKRAALVELGCDYLQGYLLGRPGALGPPKRRVSWGEG